LRAAASFSLLCEAGLVEYVENELGLTRHGRKLLRHTGLPGNADRPRRVAELVGEMEPAELAPKGSVPAPSDKDITDALTALQDDDSTGNILRPGAEVAPPEIGVPLVPWGAGGLGSEGR
jgi:hypothetical protein